MTKQQTSTIKPIRTRRDYAAAVARIETLWGAREGTAEADEADVLATLVDAYERVHFPIADPDPVAAIRFRMEQLGIEARDLSPILGSRARVWEILNGKRPLTLAMIRKLHAELRIPVAALVG